MSTRYNLTHPEENAYATDLHTGKKVCLQQKAAIKAAWEMFDDDDTSTERLLQLVADACSCTVSDVADAISEEEY